jgi:succinate-semialdehyde dehydrogenase / glutarate-semialdehyde dehydrogenase
MSTSRAALSTNKIRNAGQVCVSPTRLLVQEKVYDAFVSKFTEALKAARIGDGMESGTQMGPMANPRRVAAMETFIGDAVQKGASLKTGGHRIGNKGNFFEATVLTDVPMDSRTMNEEPFGPVAVIAPFQSFDDVVAEANRLPYGLAAYAYTRSAKTAQAVAAAVETGMISEALTKSERSGIMDEPALFHSPEAWVEDRKTYIPNDWRYAERWPPPTPRRECVLFR